jgi:hypothetical protein
MVRIIVTTVLALALAACGDSSPGPLAGTWQSMGMKTTFRDGETESMGGFIEKVSYKTEGNSVIVTAKDGLLKGSAIRYQLVDRNTMRGLASTYRKVGN